MCEATEELVKKYMYQGKVEAFIKAIRNLSYKMSMSVEEAMNVFDIPEEERKEYASLAKSGPREVHEITLEYAKSAQEMGRIESDALAVKKVVSRLSITPKEAMKVLKIPEYEYKTCNALLKRLNKKGEKVEFGLLCDAIFDLIRFDKRGTTNVYKAMDKLGVHHGARFVCEDILRSNIIVAI